MNNDELELATRDCYETLISHYQVLDSLVTSMLSRMETTSDFDELPEIEKAKQLVAQYEETTQHIREQYRERNAQPSAEVLALSTQATDLVKQMIAKVSQLEDHVRERHTKLSPQVDQAIVANRMQSAYGNKRD